MSIEARSWRVWRRSKGRIKSGFVAIRALSPCTAQFLAAVEWLRLRFSPEEAGRIQRCFNLALSRLGSPPAHVVQVEIIPSIAGDHSPTVMSECMQTPLEA